MLVSDCFAFFVALLVEDLVCLEVGMVGIGEGLTLINYCFVEEDHIQAFMPDYI